MDMAGLDAHAGHQQVEGVDHGRCAAQVGAPTGELAQVFFNRVGDQAAALASTGRTSGDNDVHDHIRVFSGQGLQTLGVVHILGTAHAKVQMNGVVHAGGQGATHDGQHGRQAGATAHAEHGAGVLLPQVGRAQRAANAQGRADFQLIKDKGSDAAIGHAADLKFPFTVIVQTGHGIGADVFGRELHGGILAGAEFDRLGQLDADAADVMGGLFDGSDRSLDDARGVHNHLVHLGQLDGAVVGQHGLAGQHIVILVSLGAASLGATIAHLAGHHAATASAAAARHATVGDGQLVGPKHVQQIASAVYVQTHIERFDDEFHDLQAAALVSCLQRF